MYCKFLSWSLFWCWQLLHFRLFFITTKQVDTPMLFSDVLDSLELFLFCLHLNYFIAFPDTFCNDTSKRRCDPLRLSWLDSFDALDAPEKLPWCDGIVPRAHLDVSLPRSYCVHKHSDNSWRTQLKITVDFPPSLPKNIHFLYRFQFCGIFVHPCVSLNVLFFNFSR